MTAVRSVVQRDDAEVRRDGRERVGAHLGTRLGQRRQQGRLAGVRRADQADVGDELELELDPALLARACPSRRASGRGGSRVAKRTLPRPPRPPRATTRRASASSSSPIHSPSGCERTTVPGGTRMTTSGALRAVRLAARAAAARRGTEVAPALEVAQRRHAGLDDEDDAPAVDRRRRRRGRRAGRAPRGGSSTAPSPPAPPDTRMRTRSANTVESIATRRWAPAGRIAPRCEARSSAAGCR